VQSIAVGENAEVVDGGFEITSDEADEDAHAA
jgi:hypothetical protein